MFGAAKVGIFRGSDKTSVLDAYIPKVEKALISRSVVFFVKSSFIVRRVRIDIYYRYKRLLFCVRIEIAFQN